MNKLMNKLLIGLLTCPLFSQAAIGDQLESVNTLMTGTVMKTGIVGSSVLGFIAAMAKGSIKMAFSIIGIALAFAYFLGWIKDGNFTV